MWTLDDIEIEFGDEPEGRLVYMEIGTPAGTLRVLGEIRISARVLFVDGAHIGNLAPNMLGRSGLGVVARKVMEVCDVDAICILGGTRTSGRRQGHVPRPIWFRR